MGAVKNITTTLAIAAIIPLAGVVQAEAHAGGCPSVQFFAVGGTGDGTSARVPGIPKGASVTRIHYSASIAPVGNVGGDVSRREGERRLDAAARSFRASCPDSKIVVQGSSMGALVAGNVRDKWQHDPKMRRNSKFVLVSDPRAKQGIMSHIPSVVPGLTMQGPRPKSTIPTSQVCRSASDGICGIGNPLKNPGHALNAAIGYFGGEHGYENREVSQSPGVHNVKPRKRWVPETPLAWSPPNVREVLEPVVKQVVPKSLPAPIAREVNRLWKQYTK